MKDLRLYQLIQRFKKYQDNSINKEQILNTVDISINTIIPNSLLFNFDDTENTIYKNIKSNHKLKSKELFYSDGMLGNLYNLKNCDYNWLLSYLFFKQYHHLFNDSIKCFHIGFGKGGFIMGMQYFFTHSINIDSIYESSYEIKWLGIDIHPDDKFVLNHQEMIIHGVECDNMLLYNNLNHTKVIIENTFNRVNLLTNFVFPKFKKNKILISIALLSLTVLHSNGVLITRILNPEYWSGSFLHYILLFGMIFENTEICRYPICKKKHVKYRYYLICHGKKNVLHNSVIYRKLVMLLKKDETKKLLFLQNITNTDIINEWKQKILELQQTYINSPDNPQDDLNDIINKIKDKLVPPGDCVDFGYISDI